MRSHAVWRTTAFWLTLCFYPALQQIGLSQQQNLYDPVVYLSFFGQVAWLRQVSDPVLLNGQASDLRRPTIQEALGLTENEARILSAVAADCELKSRPFAHAAGLLTFEARLRAVESDGASAWLAENRKNLDSQRDEMVQEHIQQLKFELGDSRFEALDAYIRSRKTANSFFPPLSAQRGAAPVAKRR